MFITTQKSVQKKNCFFTARLCRGSHANGFRSGGTRERTLVLVFGTREHPNEPLIPVFVPGEHPPKPPLKGKPPFCQHQKGSYPCLLMCPFWFVAWEQLHGLSNPCFLRPFSLTALPVKALSKIRILKPRCEKKIELSIKRHLFPHCDRVKMLAKASWIYFSILPPISNILSKFLSSALKRHLTISETHSATATSL